MAGRHQPAAYSLRGRFQSRAAGGERCNWRWVVNHYDSYGQALMPSTSAPATIMPENAYVSLRHSNSRLNCAQEMARRDSVGEVPPVPWRTVVGSGIAGEAKLDHLRLVSLGYALLAGY